MPRLLLLIPVTSYRAHDFLAAAERLGVEVVVGSDQEQVLAEAGGGAAIRVDFADHEAGVFQIRALAETRPLDAILAVDDLANVLAAKAAAALDLPHNPADAVWSARNKHRFRQRLAEAGLPGPEFRLVSVRDDPAAIARAAPYPCVLKPLTLAMSRGVIRADGHNSFVDAFHRVAAIIAADDADTPGEAADHILVEGYIEGTEYAVEGLIAGGELHVLAIFDKPDPLDGPYFEETIYVTPARIDAAAKAQIADGAARAVRAVGLTDGPVHIDLRLGPGGVQVIEVDARSIGGRCGRSLRFAGGMRLEDVILRHAAGLPIAPEEAGAGGVMMIPIPGSGILRGIEGLAAAEAVADVAEVSITIPVGQRVLELPEGSRYLGFIIAHGETPEAVTAALRQAHAELSFDIEAAAG
ncbi:MAG: ATP-grasp domain-containing protein [Alphaproteobacteria bacterium]|jgi:biotin carboxylase|nr:ATP-grasp domain-containing protein [Alphaproteobacteria bacterium]